MKRSVVVLSGFALLAGAGCVDFDQKEAEFCEGIPPEQWVTACKDKAVTPTKLAVGGGTQPLRVNSCSSELAVQLSDDAGQPARLVAASTVSLSSEATFPVKFFSDAACSNEVTNVTVTPGRSSAAFYIQGAVVGTAKVTASGAGLTSAPYPIEIIAGLPAVLTVASGPQILIAGTCSLAVELVPVDELNNLTRFEVATTVSLIASTGTATFYSDAGCTSATTTLAIPAGDSAAKLYFRETKAGTLTVTAAAPGIEAATQDESIKPGPPMALQFGSGPQSVPPDTISRPVIVQLIDDYGNLTSSLDPVDVTVTFSNFASSVSFCDDQACYPCSSIRGCSWPWGIPAGQTSHSFTFSGSAAGSDYDFFIGCRFPATMRGSISQVESIVQL